MLAVNQLHLVSQFFFFVRVFSPFHQVSSVKGLGVLDQFKIPKIHTMFRTKDKCYRANSLYQKLLLLNSWSTNNSSSKLNQSCRQIYPFKGPVII